MAYTALDLLAIEAGDAVTQDLWSLVRSNQEDFDARLDLVGVQNFNPLNFILEGNYSLDGLESEIGIQRITFDITILAGRLLIHTAGSSGSTQIDILFKRGAGAWTSIFATLPIVASGAGSYAINTGTLSITSLLAGDLLRMDVKASQVDGIGLTGLLEYEQG